MGEIKVVQGDITKARVDAIVNAANTTLMGGGGVDGAIHRAAGPGLYIACRRFNGCPTGEARITSGFNLPAQYIIHTPGPIWHGGDGVERQLLANSTVIAFCWLRSTTAGRWPSRRSVPEFMPSR